MLWKLYFENSELPYHGSCCMYADDLVVFAETEDDLIKRLNEWKDNVDNRGMRVNMNKTKVMISGEWQKVMQKAVRWPFGVCSRRVGNNSIQHTSCQKCLHCFDAVGWVAGRVSGL